MDDIRLEKRTIQERLIIAKTLIETALSDLPTAEKKDEWIPVSERLPEYGENVLCSLWDGSIDIYSREEYCGAEFWEDTYGYPMGEFKDVAAWTPLPEPYKEG